MPTFRIVFSALLCCLCLSAITYGQSNPLDKKLAQAQELYQNNKIDEAEKKVIKILDKNPEFGDGWDLLADIRFAQYSQVKQVGSPFKGKVTVTAKDKNGNEVASGSDSLARKLMEMLNSIDPSKKAMSKYVYTLRKATMRSNDCWKSSAFLRINFIDIDVDTMVSKAALKYYNQAESNFAEKHYDKAANLYKMALEEQPDFYKASMYLGDCYYAMKNYADAVASFKVAKQRFANLLEPSKYLCDAYARLNLHESAYEEAVRSMTIYPDATMKQKLEIAAYMNHQRVAIKWIPRGTFPNKYVDTNDVDLNKYEEEEDDEDELEGPWKFYKDAYSKVLPYLQTNGTLKPNSVTESKYLEVYSWEEMLKNSKDPELDEARKMYRMNYLDCYAFITCFHFDIYDQYRDFVDNNREKIAAYYKEYTIAR